MEHDAFEQKLPCLILLPIISSNICIIFHKNTWRNTSFLMKFPLLTSHFDTKHFNCGLQKKSTYTVM